METPKHTLPPTALLLTHEDKALIGAMLQEMPVSQQFAFGTILKRAEDRALEVARQPQAPPQ